MSNAFNPHAEWLGLPAELTSPNHYELLGLTLLESDQAKIAASADRAMSQVRGCKPGANAAAWAQLLDEIAAAKDCLTDPEHKRSYDQKLQLGEVFEAASAALGNPSTHSPSSPQVDPPGASPSPANPTAVSYLQPNVAAPNPMDPMAPASFAAPGAPDPMAPVTPVPTAAPAVPQATPAGTPAPAAPVAQPLGGLPSAAPAQPVAVPQPAPVAVPVQPVVPVQPTTPQAAPVASVQPMPASPIVQPAQPSQPVIAAPDASPAKPEVKQRTSATAMAKERSSGGMLLPIVLGGGVGLVVLLIVVGAFWSGKDDAPDANESEVAVVTPSPPAEAPKRVDKSSLPTAPPAEVNSDSEPAPQQFTEPVPPTPTETSPPMEVSSSQPEPSPTTPDPEPAPEPEDMGPSVEQLRDLARALTTARDAIGEQNFPTFDAEIAKAESLAILDDHKVKLRRLKLLGDYVKEFRQALDKTVADLEVGAQVPYNETISFGVVEKGPNLLIVRVGGQNRSYALNDLPPGLARRLGEMSLEKNTPETLALQAAFISVMPKATDKDLELAKSWWEQASTVPDVQDLITAINDDYGLKKELAEAGLDSGGMDELASLVDRLKDARTIEEFAEEYQAAIDTGIEKLKPGMELEVGNSTIITVEEVQSERILVQVAGRKKLLPRDRLPLGFASALAEQTIPRDIPIALVMKGAYFAASERDAGKTQFREQVLGWWEQAVKLNEDLQPAVAELVKQYPE